MSQFFRQMVLKQSLTHPGTIDLYWRTVNELDEAMNEMKWGNAVDLPAVERLAAELKDPNHGMSFEIIDERNGQNGTTRTHNYIHPDRNRATAD